MVTETVTTTSLDDIDQAVARSTTPVVVVGGDGTIARALAAGARHDVVVAPLPGGRGNDLCGALGISGDADEAACRLEDAVERRIDLGIVDGTRAFANVVSIGYDAAVSRLALAGRLPGVWSYVLAGVRALLVSRPEALRITVDGVAREQRAWMCSVSSSGRFGGGIRVCPPSGLDDGLLEVVVVDGVAWPLFVVTVLAMLAGGAHLRLPWVRLRRGRAIGVEALGERPVEAWADGEPMTTLPVDIEVRPAAVRVLLG